MKKLPLIALIAALASAPVLAANSGFEGPGSTTTVTQNQQAGGFKGPMSGQTTVAKALELSDDARVVLQGNIVKQLDRKHYEFTDSTGTIRIEISPKRWNGLTVTPKDKVEIRGKIDKDRDSFEVYVKHIQIIK
ncbi:YgiW/YdeI family stress tolerance OB fold protein [Providencia stuartii]|uniref:YgiW/YdeI family stress tolerance OB fold protein n=1 Tax=Providencia stuartii TaxID=588 RepID=UPI0034E75FBF